MALTLKQLQDLLFACGCCDIPRCCGPEVENQSLRGNGNSEGWVDPDEPYDIRWQRNKYRRRRQVRTGESDPPTISEYVDGDPGEGSYTSRTFTADWIGTFVEEYSQGFTAFISGISGTCEISEAEESFYCEQTGGWLEKNYTPFLEGGVWDNFLSTQTEGTIADIAGEPIPGSPGMFYPPCTLQTTQVVTRWERVDGVVELVPDSPGDPNPSTTVTVPGFYVGDSTLETFYEEQVTYEEFIEQIEGWFSTRRVFGDDPEAEDYCEPRTENRAYKEVGPRAGDGDQTDYDSQFFRYRIKLDKCCAWVEIRSEWDTVYYPDGEGAIPEVEPQVWEWEGTRTVCEGGPFEDHFDDEDMWSPWSDVIFVEDGADDGDDIFQVNTGEILNRNYQQRCYGPLFDVMPTVFGTYEPPPDEE